MNRMSSSSSELTHACLLIVLYAHFAHLCWNCCRSLFGKDGQYTIKRLHDDGDDELSGSQAEKSSEPPAKKEKVKATDILSEVRLGVFFIVVSM